MDVSTSSDNVTITEIIWFDGDVYMARDPCLPGCLADGVTPDDAKANLRDARIDYIDSMIEDGLAHPDWYDAGEHWEDV